MVESKGVLRLHKEFQRIQKEANENYRVAHDPENIFEWHYLVFNLKNCPFQGGYYHGKIIFPKEYPLRPPSISMVTPNGRFEAN